MSRASRTAILAATTAAAAIGAACAKVDTSPSSVISIGLDTSIVAVVVGDTLRDTLGRVTQIRAIPYNASGDTTSGAEIGYTIAPGDTGVLRLVGTGTVIGRALRATPGRVYASVGSLQSLGKPVQVIRRPARLIVSPAPSADSVAYIAGLSSAQSAAAAPAQVRIVADSSGTAVPVPEVVVRFSIVSAAPSVADSVLLVNDNGLRVTSDGAVDRSTVSAIDTTKAAGDAGRRVALFLRAGATGRDSVVLRAVIAYPALFRTVIDTVRVSIRVAPRTTTGS